MTPLPHDPGASTRQDFFLGSRDRVASLELKDRLGRTRIYAHVAPDGEARIDFLDEAGKVLKTLSVD